MDDSFSASTGDTVTLDREVPREGDEVTGGATNVAGIAAFPGDHFFFRTSMADRDAAFEDDELGSVVAHVDQEHGWGLGTFTSRSLHDDGSPGDYDLTFEIRRKPLADLHVRGVRPFESGGRQFYCAVIENIGLQRSSLAPLSVRTPGVLVRAPVLPELDPNQTTEHCVLRSELPAEQHQLSFVVDEPLQIWEMNETNNRYDMTIPAAAPTSTAPVAVPSSEPKPSGATGETSGDKPDLTVRAIRVNGQVPDGKNDCTVGKNAVTVVVKNTGKGDAGAFSVRLTVDGEDVNTPVDNLDTGQEREVGFENVPLKTGGHTLTAVADPEHAISESKEENNELQVTARCQG